MSGSQLIELTIERLAFGGDAIARHEGMIVFIPFAAPGERVLARVVGKQKGYLRAEIERVLVPAPERREAPCRHFGTCGGCQWQHLEYAAQLRWKGEILRETLRRLGGIEWVHPIEVRAGEELGYRTRARWQVAPARASTRARVGYHARRSNEVVDVEECPILAPPLVTEIARQREALRTAPTLPEEIDACVADEQIAIGDGSVTRTAGGFALEADARSFFQSNRFLLDELVTGVTGGRSGALALDLYAGVGLFTLPLARKFAQVIAVENELRTAGWLAKNRATASLTNVEIVTERVETWLAEHGGLAPDLVVLDPPRTGARDALAGLLALEPKQIVYVSCDPTTLARDLRDLLIGGMRLRSVVAFDLFPQTHHIETVATLDPSL